MNIPSILMLMTFLSVSVVQADTLPVIDPAPSPGEKSTCPVCGMFVAKYPEWVAHIRYKDGHIVFFDGAKDLFKYLLNPDKWAQGHSAAGIQEIAVTEYYDLKRIDAKSAWFVTGSDVLGPMGHELVPFLSEADANAFLKDHSGKQILRFNDVNPELIKQIDSGKF